MFKVFGSLECVWCVCTRCSSSSSLDFFFFFFSNPCPGAFEKKPRTFVFPYYSFDFFFFIGINSVFSSPLLLFINIKKKKEFHVFIYFTCFNAQRVNKEKGGSSLRTHRQKGTLFFSFF